MDSYSPVSPEYFDRAPFKFNGKIDRFDVRYLTQEEIQALETVD